MCTSIIRTGEMRSESSLVVGTSWFVYFGNWWDFNTSVCTDQCGKEIKKKRAIGTSTGGEP